MKVQKIESLRETWRVVDTDGTPIAPVQAFLENLENKPVQPVTVRTEAFRLRLFWQFLSTKNLHWQDVKQEDFIEFSLWLRNQDQESVQKINRTRSSPTVDAVLRAVLRFYKFQRSSGVLEHYLDLSREQNQEPQELTERRNQNRFSSAPMTQLINACSEPINQSLIRMISTIPVRRDELLALNLSQEISHTSSLLSGHTENTEISLASDPPSLKFRGLPECVSCKYHQHDAHAFLHCAPHPEGVESETCQDFCMY